jgi:large subunit ribosomal protein L10
VFTPLLIGPVAVLSIPTVSPEHMKAALSILAPKESGTLDAADPLGLIDIKHLVIHAGSKQINLAETVLNGAGKSIYFTLESRRSVLEEEEKGPEGDKSESS